MDGLNFPMPAAEFLPPVGPRLSCCPNPFTNERLDAMAPAGLSIGELVRLYARDPILAAHAHVWVANADLTRQDYIDAEHWEVVRPKPGALVTIRMIPQGGGGSGKSAMRLIATIAIMAAAAWAGAALAGAMGMTQSVVLASGATMNVLSAAGMGVAGVVSGAITMLGNMALNALVPPPKAQDPSAYGGSSSNPTQSITGSQNKANVYGAVPRVFGRVKINPPYAGAPYDEWNAQTQYCRLLFDFGYGPLQLSNVSIGNTLLEEYTGVNFDIRGGTVADVSVSSAQATAVAATLNLQLPWASEVFENTASDANGATFEITFPSGLGITAPFDVEVYDATSNAMLTHFIVNISPEQLVNNVYNSANDTSITNFSANYQGTFKVGFINMMSSAQASKYPAYLTSLVSVTNSGISDTSPIGIYANIVHENSLSVRLKYNVPQVVTTAADTDEISFDLTFDGLCTVDGNGNATTNSVGFRIQIFDHDTGALVGSTQFNVSAAAATNYVYSGWNDENGSTFSCPYTGQFDVQFLRLKPDNTVAYDRDDSYVSMVRSIQLTPPPSLPGHCLVALRLQATNQLNGTVQTFNAIAQALLPTWSPTTGWSKAVATGNPAWAMCEVLRGSANKRPIADSRIDLNAFYGFAQWCDQNGYSYNAVVDGQTTVRQQLIDIASVCRAVLVMKNNQFSVVWDVQRPAPVQMFTPKNSWGFKYTKNFFIAPHGLRCRFINPDKGWQQDEVIAYADGYDDTNATLFESATYAGVTDSNQAWLMGMYTIACSVERPNTYSLSCDIEHLVCNRGDLVLVSHDVMQWGLGNGLVKALTLDGNGNVTTITTDEQFTFNPGQTFVLRGRQASGNLVLLTLHTPTTITETNVLTLATPTAPAGCPAVGDLVAFGLVNTETTRLLVKSIDRSPGEFNATLTLVDEGPGVYTAGTGSIAPYNPNTTWPMQGVNLTPPPPTVLSWLADASVLVPMAGSYLPAIQFTLAVTSGVAIQYDSLEIWYRPNGSSAAWQSQSFQGRPTVVTLTGITDGQSYDFQLRWWGGNGNTPGLVSDWTALSGLYIVGRTIPDPPASMTVTYSNGIATVNVTGDGTENEWLLTVVQPTANTPQQGGVLAPTQTFTFDSSSFSFAAPLKGTYTLTVQGVSWTGLVSAGITETLTNSAAWAANAIATTPISTSGGTYAGTMALGGGGKIKRPSLKGTSWAGAPATSHDEELFNGVWNMTSANISDIAPNPVSWYVGPVLTGTGTWTSAITDMGGVMTGLWWLDSLPEAVDVSCLGNWAATPVSFAGTASLAQLSCAQATISITLTVGQQANLSDGTTFTGSWTGTGRYVQVTITALEPSWVTETYISNLVVHCDAPDVIDGGSVTTVSNPQTINFTKIFHQPPAVTLTAAGSAAVQLVAGSITTTGFQVSGTTGTVVNWAARGV